MRTPLFPAPIARRCPAWGKLLILLAIALPGAAVRAQLGQLRKTFSIYVGEMAFDPQRPLLYVSQRLGSEVNVIDIDSLAIVKTISTPAQPYGLALSADGGKLYVTQPNTRTIGVYDTVTGMLNATYGVPYSPASVAVGLNGRLYVTPGDQPTGFPTMMQVDTSHGGTVSTFGGAFYPSYYGLERLSPDRDALYAANVANSPGSLAKFEVSGATPTLQYINPHGSLGNNGKDLALSSDGQWLTYTCGGGNTGFGYFISRIRTSDMSVAGNFETGPYPSSSEFSPDGSILYANIALANPNVVAFDTETGARIGSFYATTDFYDDPFRIRVDQSGQNLFLATAVGMDHTSGTLRVYQAVPEPVGWQLAALLMIGRTCCSRRRGGDS